MRPLTFAVHQYCILRSSGVAPAIMKPAAVHVAVGDGGQQAIAICIKLKTKLRVMTVALRSEWVGFEQKVNILAAVFQRVMQTGDAGAAKNS